MRERKWGIVLFIIFISILGVLYFLYREGFFSSKNAVTTIANPEVLEDGTENVFTDIEPMHEWEFQYQSNINELPKIQIVEGNGTAVATEVSKNQNELVVKPPTGGYKKGSTYEMTIPSGLKLDDGTTFGSGKITFTIQRDKVSDITLQEGVKKLEEKDIRTYEESKEQLHVIEGPNTKDLKKDSIIIFPTTNPKYPLLARKIKSPASLDK